MQKRCPLIVTTLALAASTALAGPTPVTTTRVASGLVRPIGVFHAPGDTGRIFIIEKQGRIRILDLTSNTLLASPFLDVDSITGGGTSTSSEQGLLGLAFHPDYASNGLFYINHTNNSGDTVVAEYAVSANPNVADTSTRRQILFVDQPFSNHNGGWIAFGPDDYLYCALGDGGSANDPQNNGQNTSRLLGKMLRIDIDGDDFPGDNARNYAIPPSNPFVGVGGAAAEIWAYGLRNPWRNSFDRETGDLWIADVGQNAWEEINFQSANSLGGENYGWRCYEGLHNFNTSGCAAPGTMVFPVHEYSHSFGCSITGGYVYRGCRMPENNGEYFFADYCSATIWSFTFSGVVIQNLTNRTADLAPGGGLGISGVTSFGEDANGEIYICDQSGGEVFKIVPEGATFADRNNDGEINFFDVADFLGDFAALDPSADLNDDGAFNFFDVLLFLDTFANSCI